MSKVLLAIPVLIDNNKRLTKCLSSLNKQSMVKSGDADIYVIVNNSKDENLVEQVDKFDNGYLIINEQNLGVSGSWNQAIIEARSNYKYVSCMGFDTEMKDPNLLQECYNQMELENADFGRGAALSFNYWWMNAQSFTDKVGTFDENFYPAYWEDLDLMKRIRMLREKNIVHSTLFNDNKKIIHSQSRTVNDHTEIIPHDVWNYSYTQNQLYYRVKWGTEESGANQGFQNPFNDPRLHTSFWIIDNNRLLKSKEKWDNCLNL